MRELSPCWPSDKLTEIHNKAQDKAILNNSMTLQGLGIKACKVNFGKLALVSIYSDFYHI